MDDSKMDNSWHAFIKSVLHVFAETSHSRLPKHSLKKENEGGLKACPTT